MEGLHILLVIILLNRKLSAIKLKLCVRLTISVVRMRVPHRLGSTPLSANVGTVECLFCREKKKIEERSASQKANEAITQFVGDTSVF